MVGSGGHASLVAVQQPQLGGSGSSTRSHGGWVRQRVAVVAVRQPQHGVQNPYGRPERVIKACRSPLLIKRMNQTPPSGKPPSTKSAFLCAFTLQNPRFQAFVAFLVKSALHSGHIFDSLGIIAPQYPHFFKSFFITHLYV